MNLQKFRPTKKNEKQTLDLEESFKPTSDPVQIGNPPVEDLTRWEEDGGTILYDCFVTDQSFQPYEDEFLSSTDESVQNH